MLRRLMDALGSVVGGFLDGIGTTTYMWERVQALVVDSSSGERMAPRDGAGLLWLFKFFVLGGWNTIVTGSWVMGGVNEIDGNYRHNHDDVWYSSNGTDWTQLKSGPIWKPGHADGVCVTPTGLWHCTGSGTFDDEIVDVWRLRKVRFVPRPVEGLRRMWHR
jgi:hypothetical protein